MAISTPGHAEGPVRTVPFEQPRREQHRDKGPDVDGEVEPVEDARQQMGVARAELVADVGGDAGFDAAGAERDEPESGHQPPWRVAEHAHAGERGVPGAIDQRERDDRAVFADENIRQQRSQQRREIDRAVEKVNLGGGLGLAHATLPPPSIKCR
jgi:hypothetical protein